LADHDAGLSQPYRESGVDLVERDLIAPAIVELGGARALVRGHGLGLFERAAGLEIGGDAGRAEHMAAELDLETGFGMRRRIMPQRRPDPWRSRLRQSNCPPRRHDSLSDAPSGGESGAKPILSAGCEDASGIVGMERSPHMELDKV
jgi:hypothetical protein